MAKITEGLCFYADLNLRKALEYPRVRRVSQFLHSESELRNFFEVSTSERLPRLRRHTRRGRSVKVLMSGSNKTQQDPMWTDPHKLAKSHQVVKQWAMGTFTKL